MVEFKDIKRVLESLPYGLENITEEARLIEDCHASEEDIDMIFYYLQMNLELDLPEDDCFFRFAAHLPLKELVEVANTKITDPIYD